MKFGNRTITCDTFNFPRLTLAELHALSGLEVGAVADCDVLGIVRWNGFFWEVIQAIKENFIQTNTGNAISFSSTTATGGSLSTEIPKSQAWWNGAVGYPRLGQASLSITTVAGARQAINTASNYRLYSSAKIYFDVILSFVGGQVDFVNDATLQCWGFLDSFATATPTNGFYFRTPRVGESSFLKAVVRVAGAETITDTTIPYDSTNRRYIKGSIIWDGTNLHFWATDTINKSLVSIPNFLTTYPSLSTLNFSFGVLNARNATATTPVARNINIDSISTLLL
jgi:hypothetical protein